MIVEYRGKIQLANNFASVLQFALLAVVVSASCRVRAADNSYAPQSIPLTHGNQRLGITLSIGKEGPRQYELDTGSTQLNAAFTEVPDIPGLKTIGKPRLYLYGDGGHGYLMQRMSVPEIKYYDAGNPDNPVLTTKNNNGFVIADNLETFNTKATHKETTTYDGKRLSLDLDARALLAAGKPPKEGAYFGIFGAADYLLNKTDGGSPLANATQSGYVVAANDTPNTPGCAPCTILNLSPSVKAQFAQTVPWAINPNDTHRKFFPGSGANASNFYEGNFQYHLVGADGKEYNGFGPVLMDSGTPQPLNNGGLPGAVDVVSGTIENLDPKTGKYVVAYTLDRPGARLEKGKLMLGLPFFLKNSVMFDLEDKATGYSPFFVSANNFTTDKPLAGQQGISSITSDMGPLGLAGVISGQGNLTLEPSSYVKLTGVNTYSGLTDIQPYARLYLAGPGSIEQSSSLRNNGVFDISEHGNYNPLWGVETSSNATIRSLDGNGNVFLGDQTLALSQASGSFGGVLKDGGLGGGVGGGVTINGGIETLTGNSTYTGLTSINAQAKLVVNGSIVSPVSVNNAGVLGGSGTVGALLAQSGGTVAPGNSIGTLHTQDVTFNPGSRYAVEVGPNGRSDRLQSTGKATLNGGDVAVSLEHGPNLLAMSDVPSLLGQQYNILSASQGVSGQFASVTPYLFLGGSLTYQPDDVLLNISRNDTRFASAALTRNQRAVAAAADNLRLGDPVYESILASPNADQARQAFDQLSGQVHADIAATLMSDSRYLREAVNSRLQQAQELSTDSEITSTENGGWVQLLGNNDNISGDNNATGYSASTNGVLLGLDTEVSDGWHLGAATGYTQTKLSAESSTSANSDNYHLSFYGGKRFDSVALRAGVASTWSNLDTARGVVYGDQSDYQKSRYNARTDQVFAEIGYTQWAHFEPFANLTYLNFQSDSFNEHGGASALHANDQSQNATLSVLGLRAHTDLPVSANTMVTLRGELGWQHQYASQDREASLKFKNSDTDFAVNSVPVSRDGGLLKASAEMALTKDTLLSLNYSGLLAGHDTSNGINAGVTFRF